MGAVNTTKLSDDKDEYGSDYTVSFEHYPYSETSHEAFFLGRYSRGSTYSYKHDDMCRVRAKRQKLGRHRHWEGNVRCGQAAQDIAIAFNKEVVKDPGRITFSIPVRAEIKTVFNEWAPVGMCLGCCRRRRKKLLVGEIVLLEPYFTGKENVFFSDSTGNCENGRLTDIDREITQAFSHYSWHKSGGKYVVCGLKGRKTDRSYYFRGPTIHSMSEGDEGENYGDKDEGLEGIRSFFINHECNRLCQGFDGLRRTVDGPVRRSVEL